MLASASVCEVWGLLRFEARSVVDKLIMLARWEMGFGSWDWIDFDPKAQSARVVYYYFVYSNCFFYLLPFWTSSPSNSSSSSPSPSLLRSTVLQKRQTGNGKRGG